MKFVKVLVFATLVLFYGTLAGATSLDVALNDDSVQAQLFLPITEDAYGTSQFGIRGLYDDDDYITRLLSAEFDFIGSPGEVPGLTAGVGVIGWYGELETGSNDFDIQTLGVGARLGFAPPQLMGLGFDGKFFFGPKVLSGGDVERLYEGSGRVSYAFIPKAKVYVEYQQIHVDAENGGDTNIDSDVRVGFEAKF